LLLIQIKEESEAPKGSKVLERMSIAIEVVVALGAVLVVLIHFLHVLVLRPKSLRSKLHKQGIHGPTPHFYFGNIQEMKTLLLQQQESSQAKHKQEEEKDVCVSISHNWTSNLLPHIHKWKKQYGQLLSPPLSYLFACLVFIIFWFIL
jgi:hypothetical protein